jgi:hypothetical protein
MRANPKPYQAIFDFDGKGALMESDADRPEAVNLFQMQGWMVRVVLKERKIPVGQPLHAPWQLGVTPPESRAGKMPQI